MALANAAAWNHRAYEHWVRATGEPEAAAARLTADPRARLGPYLDDLGDVTDKRVANSLGSNGRKAVPLALLGAAVTVFDIGEENRRYALELAAAANVRVEYVLADFLAVDVERYQPYHMVFAELGILHYFRDLEAFAAQVAGLLRGGGRFLLADMHPYRKVVPVAEGGMVGDYFSSDLVTAPVAYESQFPEAERASFPKCTLRLWTLGEVITAVATAGLIVDKLVERPGDEARLPGSFLLVAHR